MDGGSVLLVIGGLGGAVMFLAAVATVLDWLGFVPNGPHIVSRIKARIQAPGKRRKLMQERADWAYDTAKHLLDTQELLMKSDRWAPQKLESLPPNIGQEIANNKSNVETLEGLLDHTATEYQLDEL